MEQIQRKTRRLELVLGPEDGGVKVDTLLRRRLHLSGTVIRRIIITLKRGGVSPIVVITGDKADEIEKHISNLQVICLRNEQYDKVQMFFSICMGLNYIEDLCDRVFVLPAKFPVFLKETVQQMMKSDADIVRPVFDGYRGHPVLVSSGVLRTIVSFQGENIYHFTDSPSVYESLVH